MQSLASAFESAMAQPAAKKQKLTETRSEPRISMACEMAKALQKAEPANPICRKRKSYNKIDLAALGEEAMAARAAFVSTTGNAWGWMDHVLTEWFGPMATESPEYKEHRNELRAAVKTVSENNRKQRPTVQGMKHKAWVSVIPARARKRNSGAGRTPMSDAIAEELWHWFVDRITLTRARIGSRLLITQANLFKSDLLLDVFKGWFLFSRNYT